MSPVRLTRHNRHLAVPLVAAVALSLGACSGDGEDTATDTPTVTPSATATADPGTDGTDPSQAPDSGSTTSPSEGAGGTGGEVVPVYFVGDGPQGPRLFREFHRVQGDPALGAARLLLDGAADDPDYRTLLPTGAAITAVAAQGGRLVVTADPALAGAGDLSPRQARLAAQSLVWTLQGAAQSTDPVVVQDASGAPTTLLGLDTAAGLTRADELDVLSLVSISDPAEGAAVEDTFTATGLASSFEATVPWEVRDASGAVVASGSTTAEGWLDRLYPWTAQVDVSALAPGTYTFAALTDDPTGGTEGPGPSEDTRTIEVS